MNSQRLKTKTISGVSALVMRNILVQPVSFIGFALLSIFLQANEIGIFWAVSEIIGFLGYFSDVGLAAAVIQKKGKATIDELRTIFTIQQILVILAILTAFLLTPIFKSRFGSESGKILYWVLLLGFFTSSLKTIPSVILEKKLKFNLLAIVDLAEQIIFTVIAVFLAWKGFGIASWTWAVLARSVVGLATIYYFSPWPIGLNFSFKKIKHLLSFGVYFQANSFLAMLKDRLMNIFLWGILGNTGIGLLGWAQKWSQMPLRFLMDSVMKVTFPAFSKLQDEKERLKFALERSGFLLNFSIFPILTGMALIMPKVVETFPQYQKWAPAIPALIFYIGNTAFASVTSPLVNAFNSVGKIKLSLRLMIMWTAASWLIIPLFSIWKGVYGASLGHFIVSATSIVAWIIAKKEFNIDLKRIIFFPFIASVIMLFLLKIIDSLIGQTSLTEIIILVFSGVLTYSALSLMLAKDEIVWFWHSFKQWKQKS
jgi:O-antigen/teichoic acid export membrane protein